MKKCFITKLIGVVENDSLAKIGEIVIHIPSKTNRTGYGNVIKYYLTDSAVCPTIYTTGNLQFCKSESDRTKLGHKITPTGKFYLSEEEGYLHITDKYGKIFEFQLTNDYTPAEPLDINDFKYWTNLSLLSVRKKGLSGDVSILKNMPKLKIAEVDGLTGNINDLDGNSNLQILVISKADGDLAKMPASLQYFVCNSKLSWSQRESGYIIAGSYELEDDVDKMLQDQAKLQKPTLSYANYINVTGNRTSASDDAISTLQSKGVTVQVFNY